MESGRWKNQYAAKNERGWFAELGRYYFQLEGNAAVAARKAAASQVLMALRIRRFLPPAS
jgi:hypothetical protein